MKKNLGWGEYGLIFGMPELPEVESQRQQLRGCVLGKRIKKVETITEKIFWPGAENFRREVEGEKIKEIGRRGKFLLFELGGKKRMGVHFRMTGHFLYKEKGEDWSKEGQIRGIFELEGGETLLYQDIRKFGKFWVGEEGVVKEVAGINKLGPEVWDEGFGAQKFWERLKKRKGMIKPLILRQDFLAGVGNIYADEALFLARIHPKKRAEDLKKRDGERLFKAIKQVLEEGIMAGGTSVGEFVGIDDERGGYQHKLRAYKRAGKPCKECGGMMKRIVVGQRGTTFCPQCQKL